MRPSTDDVILGVGKAFVKLTTQDYEAEIWSTYAYTFLRPNTFAKPPATKRMYRSGVMDARIVRKS